MAINNQTNAIISQVNLGNTLYDIHDKKAIHTLADIQSLGMDTSGVFVFKGTVATINDLPKTGNKVGYVYHVAANHSEYIWAKVDGGTSEGWEEFGEHFVVTHTHDIPVLSGSIDGSAAAQTWTQTTGTIEGTAAAQVWTQDTTNSSVTVTGTNNASAVTGSISIPKPSGVTKYMKATSSDPEFQVVESDTVLGIDTTFSNSDVEVEGTDTAKAITGFEEHQTADAITALNSTTVQEVKSITSGSQAQWSASVDEGVLRFSFTANTPTVVEAGQSENLATPTAKATAEAIVALGTAITSDCLTEVAVTAQPSITVGNNHPVTVTTEAAIKAPTITLASDMSDADGRVGYISTVTTEGTTTVQVTSGLTAAAQTWKQESGSATIKGTNAASNVTGSAEVTGTNAASKVTGGITTVANSTGQPK